MPPSALSQVVEAGPQCGEMSAELPYAFRILRPAHVPIISARLTGVNRRAIMADMTDFKLDRIARNGREFTTSSALSAIAELRITSGKFEDLCKQALSKVLEILGLRGQVQAPSLQRNPESMSSASTSLTAFSICHITRRQRINYLLK